MKRPETKTVLVFCLSLVWILPSIACSEPTAFHRQMDQFNTAYKSALNYLHTGNSEFASLELTRSRAQWQHLKKGPLMAPPLPYKKDSEWDQNVSQIAGFLAQGQNDLDADNQSTATKTLLPIRNLLHQLRHRNDVTLFQDTYLHASAAMDFLWAYRRKDIDLMNRKTRDILSTQSAAFLQAIMDSDKLATSAMKDSPIYGRLMTTAKQSGHAMILTVKEKNRNGFINYLRELKSIERMLYLHFG